MRWPVTLLEISKSSRTSVCNLCFILVCLTERNSFIRCTCFCVTNAPNPVSVSTARCSCHRETSRRPTENNHFHWKILIFTDLKKVRFNYHWPLRLKKKKTKKRFQFNSSRSIYRRRLKIQIERFKTRRSATAGLPWVCCDAFYCRFLMSTSIQSLCFASYTD